MQNQTDLYSELGLTPQATPEDIRAAYRALALRHHPDRQAGSATLAAAKMARVNHAYEVLIDSASRRNYDETKLARRRGFQVPVLHSHSCRTLAYGVQPVLTASDQRDRLQAHA